MKLRIEIHDTASGWLDAGELRFLQGKEVQVEYNVEFASQYFGHTDVFALSVTFPVQLTRLDGEIPGFLVDLIPQGNVLKNLINRHGILSDTDYERIFSVVPLASPGNIRIQEPWKKIEKERITYSHRGFTRHEVITAEQGFLEYMEQHGAPVGGTSGAAGGAPKILLREDNDGRFHADGYLDDRLTKSAWLIKFPFTDSNNSKLLIRTEKAYYDVLRELPLHTGEAIEIEHDILFIPRFDRVRRDDGKLHYLGLESFYSAHGINTHGMAMRHEDNLKLIRRYSTQYETDICEYLKRDLVNRALANTDNHGRNTSFIKDRNSVRLSPLYDVTAMSFFEADHIVPLTRWDSEHQNLINRVAWVCRECNMDSQVLVESLRELRSSLLHLESLLKLHKVPISIYERSKLDRKQVLDELETIKT
jgi:serine/threonine-protein kinase HipA